MDHLYAETKATCHMETFQKQGEDEETLLQSGLLVIHPARFPESTQTLLCKMWMDCTIEAVWLMSSFKKIKTLKKDTFSLQENGKKGEAASFNTREPAAPWCFSFLMFNSRVFGRLAGLGLVYH